MSPHIHVICVSLWQLPVLFSGSPQLWRLNESGISTVSLPCCSIRLLCWRRSGETSSASAGQGPRSPSLRERLAQHHTTGRCETWVQSLYTACKQTFQLYLLNLPFAYASHARTHTHTHWHIHKHMSLVWPRRSSKDRLVMSVSDVGLRSYHLPRVQREVICFLSRVRGESEAALTHIPQIWPISLCSGADGRSGLEMLSLIRPHRGNVIYTFICLISMGNR